MKESGFVYPAMAPKEDLGFMMLPNLQLAKYAIASKEAEASTPEPTTQRTISPIEIARKLNLPVGPKLPIKQPVQPKTLTTTTTQASELVPAESDSMDLMKLIKDNKKPILIGAGGTLAVIILLNMLG